MKKIIKFETPKISHDYDTISNLIFTAVKKQYPEAIYYNDHYFRDTYLIDTKKYRIGKEATFNNLYIEQVKD